MQKHRSGHNIYHLVAMPDWAGLSPRGILFQHKASPAELPKCLCTVLTCFTAGRSTYCHRQISEPRHSSTEPASQQHRAVSEMASHTASSNSQGFCLGFILNKSNLSISWFRLVWTQEVIYTWASKSVKTNQSLTSPHPLGHDIHPPDRIVSSKTIFLYRTSFTIFWRQWLLRSLLSDF